MALGQQNVLFLELSADGAGDEAVVLVDIATEPALSDAPMTVTLMGDEEVTLTIALPDGTMQGVVTASATDCAGNFIEEEAFMVLSNEIDTAGVFILEAEIELPYCEEDDEDGDDDEDDDEEDFDEFEDLDLDELTAYLDSLCSDAMGNDAWMYCGLLESLNACLGGDEAACEELEEWLEFVDGPWNDDDEEDDDEEDDDEEDDDEEDDDEEDDDEEDDDEEDDDEGNDETTARPTSWWCRPLMPTATPLPTNCLCSCSGWTWTTTSSGALETRGPAQIHSQPGSTRPTVLTSCV